MYGKIENHSKGEAQFAKDLYLELKAGKYEEVKEQIAIPLVVSGKLISTIIVDFFVRHKDGTGELIEYKSKATKTPVWALKWKLVKALFPFWKYTVIDHAD